MSKTFLTTTAVLEAGAGLALLTLPSMCASMFLGAPLEGPAAITVARIGGAAILVIAIACWSVRVCTPGPTVQGMVAAMLFYNVAAAAILAWARLGAGLTGIGIWPAVVLHTGLAVWCVICLRANGAPASAPVARE